MEKINDSQSACRLNPDSSGANNSTISGRSSQVDFDAATNREISSAESIQATSGKDNKQPVRRIKKKWT